MDYHHGGPGQPGPPPYVILNGDRNSGPVRPPPHRRNLPRYRSHRHSGSGCFSCICCFCCGFFLVLAILAASSFYVYIILKPQAPKYTVDHLSLGGLNFGSDLLLRTQINLAVRAENPNTEIGISYGSGGTVAVGYKDSTLCSGHLPSFYQGHANTTVINVALQGEVSYSKELKEAIVESTKGSIPLDVHVRVPVGLKLGMVDVREVTVVVKCKLVVDNLSPGKKTGIKSAKYSIALEW